MTRNMRRPGGPAISRRAVSVLIGAIATVVAAPGLHADTGRQSADAVTVREEDGIYHVAARFTVAEPVPVALAVLTDYERIPSYMAQVRTSIVRERTEAGAIVEQEAVASVVMFAKRIHLLLEVQEGTNTVSFRDTCGRSFTRYEGTWSLAEENGTTIVSYELDAQPSFAVPAFLLRRLLQRDANDMIERLRDEIHGPARQSRAATVSQSVDPLNASVSSAFSLGMDARGYCARPL